MLLIVLTLALSHGARATTEVEEARTSIRALIAPLLPGKKKAAAILSKDFRVDKCQTEKIDWSQVLLLQKEITLDFRFKEGCDIEGTVVPKIFRSFPVALRLRHLRVYDRVNSVNTVNATIESKPFMSIEMREGVLHGKPGQVKFEADYRVQLDPLNGAKPIQKNLGGELRIKEIFGKKVLIKEKIFVE